MKPTVIGSPVNEISASASDAAIQGERELNPDTEAIRSLLTRGRIIIKERKVATTVTV